MNMVRFILLIFFAITLSATSPIFSQDDNTLPQTIELTGGISIDTPNGWVADDALAPAFSVLVSDPAVFEASTPLAGEQAIIISATPAFSDTPDRAAFNAIVEYDPNLPVDPDDVRVESLEIGGFPGAISNPIVLPIPDSSDFFILRTAVARIGKVDLLLMRVAVDAANEDIFTDMINSVTIDQELFEANLDPTIRLEDGTVFDNRAIVSQDATGLPNDIAVELPVNWRVDVRDGALLIGTDLLFLDVLATGSVTQATERDGAGIVILSYVVFVFPPELQNPQALMDEFIAQAEGGGGASIEFLEQSSTSVLGGDGIAQTYVSPAGEGFLTLVLVQEQFMLQINALVAPGDEETAALLVRILDNLTFVDTPIAE